MYNFCLLNVDGLKKLFLILYFMGKNKYGSNYFNDVSNLLKIVAGYIEDSLSLTLNSMN